LCRAYVIDSFCSFTSGVKKGFNLRSPILRVYTQPLIQTIQRQNLIFIFCWYDIRLRFLFEPSDDKSAVLLLKPTTFFLIFNRMLVNFLTLSDDKTELVVIINR